MSPRASVILAWTLLFASAASPAFSQAPRRQTIAERMAALGRSWTQDEPEPARRVTPESTRTAQRPATPPRSQSESRFPHIDARSLLPSALFGGDEEEVPPTTVPAPMPGQHRRPSETTTVEPFPGAQASPSAAVPRQPYRTATRPRAGSVQERQSLEDGFTLPGLGGARLPDAAFDASGAAPAASAPQRSTNGVDLSREIMRDDPIIEPSGALGPAARTAEATPVRSTPPAAASAARQSPQRRTSTQINPDELRRELAGSFPPAASAESALPTATDTAAPDASAATTAQSEPIPSDDITPEVAADDSALDIPSQSTDTPFTLPVASQSLTPAPDITPVLEPVANSVLAPDATATTGPAREQDRSALTEVTPPASAPENTTTSTIRTQPESVSDISFGFNRAPAQSPSGTFTTPESPRPVQRRREAFGDAVTAQDPNLLATQQTPIISSDIRGPKQILVGREATYRVRLQNQGQIPAERLVANIRIPAGAEVVGTTTTQGTIAQPSDLQSAGSIEWQLTRLEAGANEALDIRLVPRSSRPLELGVSWTLAPVGSRAVVEVQEPKLRLHVAGPDEVLYGKPQLYRLTLSNPGTGTAENVKLELMPPGGGNQAVTAHTVGDLGPGVSQSIEVELTAREAGKLFVKAIALAEGGLSADDSKEIFCRKPELEVDWRGPESKFTGTEATHFFRVRNPGTAPAEDVIVTVNLPPGAALVSASEGQTFDAKHDQIAWRIGTLGPGDDYYMELKCRVNTPGKNEMKITAATSAGDLIDTHLAETNVVALADLKLAVSDPPGPVALGAEAIYEIRVTNRGQGSAKDVNVVALFSEGVEPVTVEGAMYSITDGRVSFRAIDDLAPGKDIVLRVRASARQTGTHVFRAEVLCRDLDIKLAAEETTLFYADEVFDPQQQGAAQFNSAPAPTPAGPSTPEPEVADRYQLETR